jgi:hypothetical protein
MNAKQFVRDVFFAIAVLSAAQLHGQSPKRPGSSSDQCCSVVQNALQALDRIRKGTKRSEIEEQFVIDGGLFSRERTRYSFRLCPLIKVDIAFDADPKDSAGFATGSPNDTVSAVSKPYIEYPVTD